MGFGSEAQTGMELSSLHTSGARRRLNTHVQSCAVTWVRKSLVTGGGSVGPAVSIPRPLCYLTLNAGLDGDARDPDVQHGCQTDSMASGS